MCRILFLLPFLLLGAFTDAKPIPHTYFYYKDAGDFLASLKKFDQATMYYSLALYFHKEGDYCKAKIAEIKPSYVEQRKDELKKGNTSSPQQQIVEIDKGISHLVKKEYEDAYQRFLVAANLGNDAAQTFVGSWLRRSYDPDVKTAPLAEYKTSFEYLSKGAASKNAIAEWEIGRIYDQGLLGQPDFNSAASWYRKSAEQGLSIAQGFLGACYYYGDGVEKNIEVAMKWLKLGADQGSEYAAAEIGSYYESRLGSLTLSDVIEVSELLTNAANAGFPKAVRLMGLFNTRAFVKGDRRAMGVEWLTESAESGDGKAQYQLGYYYRYTLSEEGPAALKDSCYKTAIKWLTIASENHDYQAMALLGDCYYQGCWVQKNTARAKELYTKAAEGGSSMGKERLDNLNQKGRLIFDDDYNFGNSGTSYPTLKSNSSQPKKCSACSGRGYVYSGDNRRESCYVCGGSGSN